LLKISKMSFLGFLNYVLLLSVEFMIIILLSLFLRFCPFFILNKLVIFGNDYIRAFPINFLKFKLKFSLRLYFFYFNLLFFKTLLSNTLFLTLFY
jgi:hypothetical protein